MQNGNLENESDEVLALKFELENAKEAIADILNFLSNTQEISLTTLRQKLKSSLNDFANVCLTQIQILNKSQNPLNNAKLPQIISIPPMNHETKKHFPIPLLPPHNPGQIIKPPDYSIFEVRNNRIEPRYRKQNLFDDIKFLEVSEDSGSEDSDNKDSSSEVVQIHKSNHTQESVVTIENNIKGDIKATTEFLDEYRKKIDLWGVNENCPEKFTHKQLESLGSTPYKKAKTDTLEECEMCFEEYLENQKVSFLTCHHKFHTVCIKTWLLCKNECPVCGLKACLEYDS